MIFAPLREDLKLIGWGIGHVILGVGAIMLIPLGVAALSSEWNVALDFAIGILTCLIFSLTTELTCHSEKDFSWSHGLIVAAAGWIVAMVLGAIPHYLSGHFGSYLDACFDLMSGYTTTGLYLLQDLDHASNGLNMWRHLLTYVGGQGIIVFTLTFLFAGTAGAFKIYVGEGKEEKILPNVIQTARAIWIISLTYLIVGSAALWISLSFEGMSPGRSLLHSIWLFMGAWSTGGFAPQSLNLLYYHSFLVEILTMVIFVIGSFNFALHYAVWQGKRSEIVKNVEIRSFATTVTITALIMGIGMQKMGTYGNALSVFRKGFYNLVSAHTTTGNNTIYATSFIKEFGFIAMWATIIAMAIGASACSTGGGFKGFRMGILYRSIRWDVRRMVSPESSVVVEKIHHIKDIFLDDRMIKSAMTIILCYVAVYVVGGILGIMYGYSPSVAFFDAVSAASNTGHSAGLVSPGMPVLLKIYYIFAMWAGRLEFVSVFALGGMIVSLYRGERLKRTLR